MEYKEVTRCRICDCPLVEVLDLGAQVVATHFPKLRETLPYPDPIPLALGFCIPCALPQLLVTIPPVKTFSGYYGYRSGTNPMMVETLNEIYTQAIQQVNLMPDDCVCDIGANDGTLLQMFPGSVKKIAYEPAEVECVGADVRIRGFFPSEWPRSTDRAKIITAVAMFYDVEDPLAFLHAVRKVLHPDGVFVVEVADFSLTMQNLAFDAICHEHLCYYSFRSLHSLLAKAGFRVVQAERTATNGGSIRVFAKHEDETKALLIRDEFPDVTLDRCRDFGRRVYSRLREVEAYLSELPGAASLLGASTKGMVFLQSVGLDGTDFLYAEDISSTKVGRVTPWGEIPIVLERTNNWKMTKLVLPWHFLPEFIRRQSLFLDLGGTLLIALPEIMPITRDNREAVLKWFSTRLGIPSTPRSMVLVEEAEAKDTSSTTGS